MPTTISTIDPLFYSVLLLFVVLIAAVVALIVDGKNTKLRVAEELPAPTKDEFIRVINEMALGTSADKALLNVHIRTRVTEYAIFAVTISVQTHSGGRLVESVQKLAETVRYRLAMTMRAEALAGEARVSAILLRQFASDKLERRVLGIVGVDRAVTQDPAAVPLGAVGRFLRSIGRRMRSGSGLNPARLLPLVLGAKLMFTLLIPALAITYGVVAGLSGLQFVRRPYVAALRRGLPDALDLLVICTEPGMGLDMALEQVAKKIAASNAAIAVALTKLLDELRVLPAAAAEAAPDAPSVQVRAATGLARAGKWNQARDMLLERVKAHPKDPDLLRALASIYVMVRQSPVFPEQTRAEGPLNPLLLAAGSMAFARYDINGPRR